MAKYKVKVPNKIQRVSRLMRISLVRISLLRFSKIFHKYLPYANFGLFISLVRFFGDKIAKNRTNEINSPKFTY